jgi:hypothetical protein
MSASWRSHPSRKNKNAARVGHPGSYSGVGHPDSYLSVGHAKFGDVSSMMFQGMMFQGMIFQEDE